MTGDPNPNPNPAPSGDTVQITKQELDNLKSLNEKLSKDLEDVRSEVLTDEYSQFLDSLEKKGKVKDEPKPSGEDDEFKNLTPRQIHDRAVAEAEKRFREGLEKEKSEAQKREDDRRKREVTEFAKTHDDFEKYRPTMYGLSRDPKFADLNLEQLYIKAKEHVKSLHPDPSEDDKAKSRRSSNFKPGGDNESLAKIKGMSNEDIAKASLDEVIKELGPIPSA